MNPRYCLLVSLSCLLSLLLYSDNCKAQSSLDAINEKRCRHNWNGMIIFSTWTSANIISSTVGLLTTEGSTKHFFEMASPFIVARIRTGCPLALKTRSHLDCRL